MAIKHVKGSIKDNLSLLDDPVGDDLRVYCLYEPQTIPYTLPDDADGFGNVAVDLVGGLRAKFVGINNLDYGKPDEILVSDSFSPCVPVIATYSKYTALAHRNGSSVEFARPLRANGSIFILQKLGFGQNEMVAENMFERLQNEGRARLKVVALPIGQVTIGIIVKGAVAIVYQH